MKKWLSLLVMTSILLGAAYFAVATESGRKVQTRSAKTLSALEEIDAMLATDPGNQEFLDKRAQIVEELATRGISAPALALPDAVDEEKAKIIATERAKLEASGEYYGMLLERLNNGSTLTTVEKAELLQSGMLKGEEDPAYQAVVAELENASNARLDLLSQRYSNNERLSEAEKIELEESGFLETRNEGGSLDGQGADCFGYRYVDNLNGDTATFAWEEIVGMAGTVELTTLSRADDAVQSVALPFSFPFYGVNRTTVYPSTNGAVGMTSVSSYSNTCTLPTSTFPSGAIWPFWDDQHTNYGGTGVSATVSDSGNVFANADANRVIIQWDSVGRLSPQFQHTYTYQCILYPDGKIKVQIKAIDRYAPSIRFPSATMGIQQGSTAPNNNYVSYSCNTITEGDASQEISNLAIWYYPSSPIADDFVSTSVVAPVFGRPSLCERTVQRDRTLPKRRNDHTSFERRLHIQQRNSCYRHHSQHRRVRNCRCRLHGHRARSRRARCLHAQNVLRPRYGWHSRK